MSTTPIATRTSSYGMNWTQTHQHHFPACAVGRCPVFRAIARSGYGPPAFAHSVTLAHHFQWAQPPAGMGNEAPPAAQPPLAAPQPHAPFHARTFSDLVLTLREAPHPHYVRRQNDLVTRAVIPLATALCGGTVHLRQLDGRKVREAGPASAGSWGRRAGWAKVGSWARVFGDGRYDRRSGRWQGVPMLHVRLCVSSPAHYWYAHLCPRRGSLLPVAPQLPLVITDVVHPGSETIILDEGMPLPAEEQPGAHQPAVDTEQRGNMVVIFKVRERQHARVARVLDTRAERGGLGAEAGGSQVEKRRALEDGDLVGAAGVPQYR